MTRGTYLRELKKNLSSLSEAEIADAIAYYSNYFDDANDDQKVINELGTPAELAQMIIEKSQKHLAQVENQEQTEDADSQDESRDALYFEYDRNVVKGLQLNFGAAEVVLISGKNLCVESRGIDEDALTCSLSSNGVLSVNNQKRVNFDFFSHNKKFRAVPRILVTIPENFVLTVLKVKIGAGSLISRDITIDANEAYFEVEAGNISIGTVNAGCSSFRCGMGNLVYDGSLIGHSNIDCGMGNVKLTLKGNIEEYSYDGKVGLGDLKINNEKKSGVGQIECSQKKGNHLSVNVGMGNVTIKMSE